MSCPDLLDRLDVDLDLVATRERQRERRVVAGDRCRDGPVRLLRPPLGELAAASLEPLLVDQAGIAQNRDGARGDLFDEHPLVERFGHMEVERTYGTPALLEEVGPLVRASWAVPKNHLPRSPYFRAQVPDPVCGYMAVDTGSNRTWIAQEVVAQLGLRPFREEVAHGSNGTHPTSVYLVELNVPFAGGDAGDASILSVLPVAAVPGLSDVMPLRDGDEDVRIVGLLGRDFSRHVRFTYDGPSGSFRLQLNRRDLVVRVA